MFRIIAIGLAALGLVACQPAPAQVAPVEPAPRTAAEWAALEVVWAELEDKYLEMETMPADPIDALEWREVHCNFLGGELGGDPEQDRAINARIEEICTDQREHVRALRAARINDPAAVARLDAYISRHYS